MVSIDNDTGISIEMLISHVNKIISRNMPETILQGEFLDYENCLIYDLHLNSQKSTTNSSIRFVHSDNMFQVLRV